MTSPRSNSTSTIQEVLEGKNLEIAGTQKIGTGSNRLFAGCVTLTSLGIHALTLHPAVTVLSVFAHMAVGAVGAYWTIDGVAKISEGSVDIECGQKITKYALTPPSIAGNVYRFTAVTLGTESASTLNAEPAAPLAAEPESCAPKCG